MNIEKNTKDFKEILRSTGRKGVEDVLSGLEKLGFFKAPASAKFHLSEEGGLCQHCLNVYCQADVIRTAQIKLNPKIEKQVPMDS